LQRKERQRDAVTSCKLLTGCSFLVLHKRRKPIIRKQLAVFASGAGSTLRAVHEAVLSGELPDYEVALVISNNSRCGAIEYAREQTLEHRHISIVTCGSDEALSTSLLGVLESSKVDAILLAGYMKRLPDAVVSRYQNRILNVHPALLPAFGGTAMYGDRVHQAVLDRGCKVSGATVHFVSAEYDAGPIIAQECCKLYESDTVETLRTRVQAIEQRLLLDSLRLLASDRLRVSDGRVSILESNEE
jgi:phosphoribosylglycinamide formyltransferase-1